MALIPTHLTPLLALPEVGADTTDEDNQGTIQSREDGKSRATPFFFQSAGLIFKTVADPVYLYLGMATGVSMGDMSLSETNDVMSFDSMTPARPVFSSTCCSLLFPDHVPIFTSCHTK